MAEEKRPKRIPKPAQPSAGQGPSPAAAGQQAAPRRADRPKRRPQPGKSDATEPRPTVQGTSDDDQPSALVGAVRNYIWTTPAWLMSLVVHVIVILALALVTFATVQRKPEVVLTATSVDGQDEPIEEFSEVEFEEIEDVGMEDPILDPEVSELTDIAMSDVAMPAATTSAPSDSSAAASSSSSGQPSTSQTTKPGRTSNKKGTVSFYGSKSKGNRFVFVVDNSGSMVNGRMLTTLDQLMSAVNQMTQKQDFYVIFFSDTAYPLFYPNAVDDLVPANKQNKRKLAEWLRTVELCRGGDYETAMKVAFDLHPDVIFLLGDGGGVGKDEMRLMTDPNMTRPTINTFAMGAGRDGAQVLAAIAQANRGSFTPVQAHPAAIQLSRQNPLPYHKDRPGTVWGQQVRR